MSSKSNICFIYHVYYIYVLYIMFYIYIFYISCLLYICFIHVYYIYRMYYIYHVYYMFYICVYYICYIHGCVLYVIFVRRFDVPGEAKLEKVKFPEIRTNSEKYGTIADGALEGVPISGVFIICFLK